MNSPILEHAKNLIDHELAEFLSSPEVVDAGNHGFTGETCDKCGILTNVAVSYIWTCQWICVCGHTNLRPDVRPWPTPHEKPEIGPSKTELNLTLCRLGLHGCTY